jgi:hypothetical protein
MKTIPSVAAFATLATALAQFHIAQAGNGCIVWDRYGGQTEIGRNVKHPNLGGMRFPSHEVCKDIPDVGISCHTVPGGKMDDKINGVTVPIGCTAYSGPTWGPIPVQSGD